MIKFDDVSYTYDKKNTGLKNINLQIKRGDFVFICGSTAEYKTTILNLIYASIYPTSGSLKILDYFMPEDKKKSSEIQKHIGYVYHDFNLFDNLTVEQNLLITLCIKSHNKHTKEYKDFIYESLKNYPYIDASLIVSKLSSGEKQILNFIRALIPEPQLLLADDPFKHFQKSDVEKIMTILEEKHNKGMTIVITSTTQNIPNYFKKKYYTLKTGRIFENAV